MYKVAFVLSVFLLSSCASSSLRINKYVDTSDWEKIAIMPVIGKYSKLANRKLTYQLASKIRLESILPEYMTGDIELEIRKRRLDGANLALHNIIANKYNADALLHTSIVTKDDAIGSRFTVFMKVIDIKTSQVFAMSKKESDSYFSDESVVEDLIDEALEEISIPLGGLL